MRSVSKMGIVLAFSLVVVMFGSAVAMAYYPLECGVTPSSATVNAGYRRAITAAWAGGRPSSDGKYYYSWQVNPCTTHSGHYCTVSGGTDYWPTKSGSNVTYTSKSWTSTTGIPYFVRGSHRAQLKVTNSAGTVYAYGYTTVN